MISYKKLSIAIFSLFFVGFFYAQKNKTPMYQREWMLISFQDFSKEYLMEQKAELNLSQKQFSAFMGCNQLMIQGKFNKNKTLKLEVVGATMSFCEGNMQLEKQFSLALATMKKYKIDGHFLTLYNNKGEKMKFVAADWD
ncbi:MAG: META domain-containing protein [Bacteroidetes bacterium]|nr:META domain-containing protein [Bacteroidota bacterium]